MTIDRLNLTIIKYFLCLQSSQQNYGQSFYFITRIVSLVNCQSGGIGRHVGFKIQCSLGVWVRVPPLVRESAVTYVTVDFFLYNFSVKIYKIQSKDECPRYGSIPV